MRLGGFGEEKVRNGCGQNLSLWLIVGYCMHTVSIARYLVDLLDVVGKYVMKWRLRFVRRIRR